MRKFIASIHFRGLGILLCVFLGVLLTQFYMVANVKVPFKEVLLEFIPMQSPIATYVKLDSKGNVEVLRYMRSRLLVVETFDGILSEHLTSQIFANSNKAFTQALPNQSYSSSLMQGDQFHLIFISAYEPDDKVFGFVHLAPKTVSSTIAELLGVVKYLKSAQVATAYIKSEPISKERFAHLQSSGLLNNFEKLSTKLRKILQPAIDKPYRFIGLKNSEYKNLLYRFKSEFLLNQQGNGYQIELFTKK